MGIKTNTKPSESTMLYDRYEEWTKQVEDTRRRYHWYLGEYVDRNDDNWRDCLDDFSVAFCGASGSGKTNAMRHCLTLFLCKNPLTHVVLCDLKDTGDWDVFKPLTDPDRIIKNREDTFKAISYVGGILKDRQEYMAANGYANVKLRGNRKNENVKKKREERKKQRALKK